MATKVGRIDFIFLIPPFTWPLNPLLTFLAYFLAYFYTVSQIIAFSFVNSEISTSYEELQTVWNNFGWSFLKAEVTTQCQTARQRTTRFVQNVRSEDLARCVRCGPCCSNSTVDSACSGDPATGCLYDHRCTGINETGAMSKLAVSGERS